MSEKITWTHVDRHVRFSHDQRGMLETGMTDAEVTLSYIKLLERELRQKQERLQTKEEELERAYAELESVKALPLKKPGKTKQRLATLEAKLEHLSRYIGTEL